MPTNPEHHSPQHPERVQKFEILVDELMKEKSDDLAIKNLMSDLGVDYSEDPIIRINRVLQALHNTKQ